MISAISRYYVERLEPFFFRFRRAGRLRMFGLDSVAGLSGAALALAGPCSAGRLCERLLRLHENYYARYARRNPDGRVCLVGGLAAVLPLAEFPDFDAYKTTIRKKSNFFARKAKKATQAGYSFDIFNRANFTPDIVALRKSMKFRAFGPVLDAFFLTLKSMGGAPLKLHSVKPVDCVEHWEICLGVFLDRPGYTQGEVVVDRQLVAYIRLHRCGNVVRFADFMGHCDHLSSGVMMLLQMETMRWLMREDDPTVSGIQYATYGSIEQGSEGLLFWKRKALFRPMLLEQSGKGR